MKRSTSGFTIVELLIVIVVIGILAAISVVAYTGVQQRARDAKRKDDLAKIVKGFQLWSASNNGDFGTMSAGSGGNEAGWFNLEYAGYPIVASVLVNTGFLSDGVVDPINRTSSPTYAYMISTCTSASDNHKRVILARLEIPPAESLDTQLGETCPSSTLAGYVSTYSMNYGKMIDLR